MYAGVPLAEVLKEAGVKFRHDPRGQALAAYLVVEVADGYRAVFALPKLDPEIAERVIMLANRRDGKLLDANEKPFRVIVSGEKRHGRWVKRVVTLKIRLALASGFAE